jgi:hypothetical protein
MSFEVFVKQMCLGNIQILMKNCFVTYVLRKIKFGIEEKRSSIAFMRSFNVIPEGGCG